MPTWKAGTLENTHLEPVLKRAWRIIGYRPEVFFACDVAERALPHYERQFPGDTRPRAAIEAARRYARGEISRDELYRAERQAAYAAASSETGFPRQGEAGAAALAAISAKAAADVAIGGPGVSDPLTVTVANAAWAAKAVGGSPAFIAECEWAAERVGHYESARRGVGS